MKRALLTYRMPPWSKEKLARLREIERDFHVRAFGEELAHVNLDLTIEERHQYLDWMRELAQKHGVPPSPRLFDQLAEGLSDEEKYLLPTESELFRLLENVPAFEFKPGKMRRAECIVLAMDI